MFRENGQNEMELFLFIRRELVISAFFLYLQGKKNVWKSNGLSFSPKLIINPVESTYEIMVSSKSLDFWKCDWGRLMSIATFALCLVVGASCSDDVEVEDGTSSDMDNDVIVEDAEVPYDFETDGIYYLITAEDEVGVMYESEDFVYYGEGKECYAYKGEVKIPSTVTWDGNTYMVTSIRESAFRYCVELTSMTFPSSVEKIAWCAFADCENLTNVTLEEGLRVIGTNVFFNCTSLTSITIPSTVTDIEGNFEGCKQLMDVYSLCETPPTGPSQMFPNEIYSKATLHIPTGTSESYAAANGWCYFQTIVEEE